MNVKDTHNTVAVCCSVLQCVAVCCSVMQCVVNEYRGGGGSIERKRLIDAHDKPLEEAGVERFAQRVARSARLERDSDSSIYVT